MNCIGEKTSGYGTGVQLSKNTFTDVEGALEGRGVVTWYNRVRLNNLFDDIGFKVVYTEDNIEKQGQVLIEKLITCLTIV